MALTPDPALTNGMTDATPAPQPTPDNSASLPQAGLPGQAASDAINPAASAPAQVTQQQAAALAPKAAPTSAAPTVDPAIAAASTGKGATSVLRGILLGALRGAETHIASAGKAVGKEGVTFLKAQPAYQQRVAQQQDMQLKQQANARENQTAMTAQQEAALRISIGNLTAHHMMLENQKEKNEQDAEQNKQSQDFIGFLTDNDIPFDVSHGAGHDQLTADDAKAAGNGSAIHLSNGQTGDKAGVAIVDTRAMQGTVLSKPYTFTASYKVNEKGEVVPDKTATIPAGASAMDAYNAYQHSQKLLTDAQAAQDKAVERQTKQADLTKKQSENANAPQKDADAHALSVADTAAKNASAAKTNQERAQSAAVNPPGSAGLNGDAYLATLTPGEAATIKAVAEGRQTLSPRQLLDKNGNATPFAQQLHRAYPDFDDKKALGYGAAVKDFTSGKTAQQVNAGNTALIHLARLKQINDENPVEVRIHGTKANQEYNNLLDTVADELGTFYGEPKTDAAIASKKSTLGSFTNRDAAIKEQAKAMGAKFDSIEQTWKNAAPTAAYEAPLPGLSQEGRNARAALDPAHATRVAQSQTQSGTTGGNNAPTAQTHVFDPQAWAAANPGKDVNAAIQLAQSKGYQVKQ
jgi:hypothetical protein